MTGTRARSMYSQSAVFPRLAVIQSAKWKDRNGLWFGFGIIHYAAHNTPSPATAVLHIHIVSLPLTTHVYLHVYVRVSVILANPSAKNPPPSFLSFLLSDQHSDFDSITRIEIISSSLHLFINLLLDPRVSKVVERVGKKQVLLR